ncbi:MAG: beta-N-acetylhexosaminidase [Gammaproteobacteria bacterium]
MPLGPVMVDVAGCRLGGDERELLRHPQIGGIILFARNFSTPHQLRELVAEIHALRDPRLLVAVDQEGGRVQRFRDGFTALPPARCLGELHEQNARNALECAEKLGWLMAAELRAAGVDFSFAPVLDLDRGVSKVIANRALHRNPETVAELARQIMKGMRRVGMVAVGKHFPGHGAVAEDSHDQLPVDKRPLQDIMMDDALPFARMIRYGLAGIMPAHVVYPEVDDKPVGFSSRWLQTVLRLELGFEGVIFSDDLSMEAAVAAGDYAARARAALDAGCDMVLICNRPEEISGVLEGLGGYADVVSQARLARLHGRGETTLDALRATPEYVAAVESIEALNDSPWMEMNI